MEEIREKYKLIEFSGALHFYFSCPKCGKPGFIIIGKYSRSSHYKTKSILVHHTGSETYGARISCRIAISDLPKEVYEFIRDKFPERFRFD